MSFSMLLNLVETSNADNKELLWKFVKKYKKDIIEKNYQIFDALVASAIKYYNDEIKSHKKYKIYNIDYLNIDIEGHEFEVLKTFNFKKFKVNVICVELLRFNKISDKRKNLLISLLRKNKFKLVDKSQINYIFKRIK